MYLSSLKTFSFKVNTLGLHNLPRRLFHKTKGTDVYLGSLPLPNVNETTAAKAKACDTYKSKPL